MKQKGKRLPETGMPKEQVLAAMRAAKGEDINWREGKAFSLVYHAGVEAADLLRQAYNIFLSENALNPTAFPSLRRFETDVISMTAHLLGGDERVVGNMTSGGTESILMAVKTARDWARARHPRIKHPQMILPLTAHPAFEKAAHYFCVKAVRTPVGDDFRADVEAAAQAITGDTVLMVGSAPSYPQGVIDPIADLAAVAKGKGILFHVDACMGGFMLPFVRRAGYPVPDFDFSVPGVTSISVDLHKFGYAAKGASVILYANREIRRHQLFAYTDWSGGIYASPTMTGTRPGGAIAAAWAIMNHLGEAGYTAMAEAVMDATVKIRQGVDRIKGIHVLGDPEMSVFALASDEANIYDIGDEMALRGWYLERQQFPPCLHMTVNYRHVEMVDAFLQDLSIAVAAARKPSRHRLASTLLPALANVAARLLPERFVSRVMSRAAALVGVKGSQLPQRSAAMYGMMGTLPNRGDLKELVLDLVEQFTEPQDEI